MFIPVCPYVDLFLLFRGKHNKIRIFHFPKSVELGGLCLYSQRMETDRTGIYHNHRRDSGRYTVWGIYDDDIGIPALKARSAGRKFLNIFVIVTMLYNGGLVHTYIMYTNYFHIKNTYMALLIPSLMLNAFYIMITRSYIQSNIPEELVEACRIDGASETKIFWKMVLPLSKPIFVTLVLFIGIGYWNDWLNGMYYLTEPKYFSIQNLLNKMLNNVNFLATNSTVASQAGNVSIPSITIRMAIAMVGILPIIIIYPFLQKYFVKGITLGAVKG